jgi:7-carboxy-7-deazaguanine synthase
MIFSVKEIFYTLQGEGLRAGRAAVFCRFSGCNLWSGLEKDRANAVCKFCDTDFVSTNGSGGGKFSSASLLATEIASYWPKDANAANYRYVVLTVGEPMLQVNDDLINALHNESFEIAIETNGTLPVPSSIDWICVSPKAGAEWAQKTGHELKLVYPQDTLLPQQIPTEGFDHYLLQPMDGPQARLNMQKSISYCQANPKWRLSVQTHKYLQIR